MDIKKAIEKLNSIDAKDLKKIDFSKLKEINLDRIREELTTKPKILINSIFILAAVIVSMYSLNYYLRESGVIAQEIVSLNQKLEIISAKKTVDVQYAKFLSELPEIIPNNQLIGKISDFAEKTKINIISFSPVRSIESEYVNQYIVNLSIKAAAFQDLVNFLNTIENSKYTLKVNKCSARVNPQYIRDYQGEEEVPIDAVIEISSIKLNNV